MNSSSLLSVQQTIHFLRLLLATGICIAIYWVLSTYFKDFQRNKNKVGSIVRLKWGISDIEQENPTALTVSKEVHGWLALAICHLYQMTQHFKETWWAIFDALLWSVYSALCPLTPYGSTHPDWAEQKRKYVAFQREMQPGGKWPHIGQLASIAGLQGTMTRRVIFFLKVCCLTLIRLWVVIQCGHYLSRSLSLRSDRWIPIICYLASSYTEGLFTQLQV